MREGAARLVLLIVVACGGEEPAAPPPRSAPAGPQMGLCAAGSDGCAVGKRPPVESYQIPLTPTPAEPPRFADIGPRLAAPAPALPAGCLAVLGSTPRAALHGETAFALAVSSAEGGSVLELSHVGARRHRVEGGSGPPEPLAGVPTAVTADGSVVALAVGAGVRIVRDGAAPGVLLEESSNLGSVELDARGARAVALRRETRGRDTAVAWDTATGRVLWRASSSRPAGGRDGWQRAALAPDGWAVAIASATDVSLRDGRDGRELVLLGAREQAISDLGFLPDGRRLAVAGSDLRIYDVTTGRQIAERQLVDAEALAVDPAGGRIATVTAGGAMTLHEPTLEVRATASMFPFPRRLAFSPDGRLLAASHLGGAISVWQVDPPALLAGVSGHSGTAVAIESGAGGLVSLGAGRVCRWPEPPGGRPSCLEGFEHAALAPGGGAVAASIGGGVWLYRGDSVQQVASIDPRFGVLDLAFTRDGRSLLVLWGRSLEVRDAASGRLVRTLALPDHTMADLHAASPRHALFSRSSDAHLFIADLSGRRAAAGPLDFAGHWSSAWAPDGRSAIAADWKLRRFGQDGALLAELALEGQVQAGAWSPDGRWYAAASDRAVAAYAAAGNRALWTSTSVAQPIAAIDRDLLAARDREAPGTVVLLDARSGERRGALVGGELAGQVDRLFALPGRRLAAAAWEGRILLWQVP